MIIIDRNFYIIKQSNGTTWKFSFSEDETIIYRFFKENTWSDEYVLTQEALKNFSVILLPDDSINVLYQDSTGTIILSKYDEEQWNKQEILTNEKKEIFSIYFKTAIIENKIQIIFSIFNKENTTATLFHQSLDEKNNLSNPKIIDKIKYDCDYNVPFILYSPNNKELFIMYQRFMDSHEIGYKAFNSNDKKWSSFKLIDRSDYPFKDYSAIMFNNILHALYIKEEENIENLIYVHGNDFNFNSNNLFKGINIESCLIFIICGEIWCFWIANKKILISFSIDNGNKFSTTPYELSINSPDIFKSIYISNNIKEVKGTLGNEIYFTNDDTLQYLVFSNLCPSAQNNQKSDSYMSYTEYYMSEICLKVLSYEKESRKKEQLIIQLSQQLEDQKAQMLSDKNKFSENITSLQEKLANKEQKLKSLENLSIEKENEILSLKDKLFQNLNSLQKSLADKEEKLKLLEKLNIEKENEILSIKKKLSQNIILLQNLLTDREEKLKLLQNINAQKENEVISLKEALSKDEGKILYLLRKIIDLDKNLKIMYTNIYQQHSMY